MGFVFLLSSSAHIIIRMQGSKDSRQGAAILASSRVISLVTLVSRFFGLAREIAIAAYLGNSYINDRLAYAFAIPNLFRRLFGEGALSAGFIPVLNQWLHREGKSGAQQVFSAVASLLAVILAAMTVLLLGLIGLLYLFGQDSAQRHLTLGLTAVMLPYMIFVCLVALFAAMLNCLQRFALAAFVPIILSVFQIAAVIVAQTWISHFTDRVEQQVYVIAVAVLLAGVVQLLLVYIGLRRLGVRWQWCWRVRWQPVGRIATMMGPMMLGLGAFQFGAWLDSQVILMLSSPEGQQFSLFGWQIDYPLIEGSLSALDRARRLYTMPLGVLGIALATAAFPAFSRYAAANDHRALGGAVCDAMRVAVFEGLASGTAMILLAPLIVAVVFQRGNFSADNTVQTAYVLRFYCIGLWAYCLQPIILRGFYSMQDVITPLKVTAATLLLNLVLNLTLLWVPALKVAAFGLSTSITATLNVIILGWILSRRLGGISFVKLADSIWRTAVACVVMCAACYLTVRWFGQGLDNKYLLLGATMIVGTLTLLITSRLIGCKEPAEIIGRQA